MKVRRVVPHGSVLRPLSFLLYIIHLTENVEGSNLAISQMIQICQLQININLTFNIK
jgi:hypothetical protein